jgi:hypothetical protein
MPLAFNAISAAATLAAFLLAFLLSALIGLALGLLFGARRFARRGTAARRLLYHPQSHALSGRAADLRPRHVCQLAELGFGCVLYANAALQAALKASHEVLMALKRDGSLASVADRMASFAVRQQAVAKSKYDELECRYRQ